ncbi:hypothetical protein FHG87_021164 [Trinorchestia longiramus]|nr:hypothetical protein FHG87_021164 [Trinorchestia longiramus]
MKEEDARSKRKVNGDVNDGARHVSERDGVNENMNGPWTKVNGKRIIEMNRINDRDEQNRVNEKMNGSWIKVGGRKINEMHVKKESVLIETGCFMGDAVLLLQEGETKLSQRFICWIKDTHLLMQGRMD